MNVNADTMAHKSLKTGLNEHFLMNNSISRIVQLVTSMLSEEAHALSMTDVSMFVYDELTKYYNGRIGNMYNISVLIGPERCDFYCRLRRFYFMSTPTVSYRIAGHWDRQYEESKDTLEAMVSALESIPNIQFIESTIYHRCSRASAILDRVLRNACHKRTKEEFREYICLVNRMPHRELRPLVDVGIRLRRYYYRIDHPDDIEELKRLYPHIVEVCRENSSAGNLIDEIIVNPITIFNAYVRMEYKLRFNEDFGVLLLGDFLDEMTEVLQEL